MPVWMAVADTRRWLVATVTGRVSFEELATFIGATRSGEPVRWPLVFDASAATSDATPHDMDRLVDIAARAKTETGEMRGPVALVAPTDAPTLALMERYYALYDGAGVGRIRMFTSRDEAESWLSDTTD
jgi:hypothetical protein